ncbi:MAG TPA: hypothetical protein DCX00_00050 [Flavobacteriales bacterium]|nr:hypothetical protein [Flavobacteriales bacterium]
MILNSYSCQTLPNHGIFVVHFKHPRTDNSCLWLALNNEETRLVEGDLTIRSQRRGIMQGDLC